MPEQWDTTVDILVAGTGATALTAAISAHDGGSDVLIVESTAKWGGTTSYSGGGIWMPNSPSAVRDGLPDSVADARLYMDTVIGDAGPASSPERRTAFLDQGPKMLASLEAKGVRFVRGKKYPDYYPDKPGGRIGRTVEVKPFNGKRLGEWITTSRMTEGAAPFPMMTDDVAELSRAWISVSGFIRGGRLVARTLWGLVTFRTLRGMGTGLVFTLMDLVLKAKIPIWLESPVTELVIEDGRCVGVVVTKDGKPFRIRALQGVILGAGGFAHRTEWREKYHGIHGWSAAAPGDLGTAIEAGITAGAAIDLMDDAWWGCTPVNPITNKGGFMLWERSMPHGIIVDQGGNRFMNESESYTDIGHHILERRKIVESIPAWLVTDHSHAVRYLNQTMLTDKKVYLDGGMLFEADTLEELAVKMEVPVETLLATIDRFNSFVPDGVDRDFGRGNTAYDNYYSDPYQKPNPNLGLIAKGPFRALKLWPADLGTKGGLLTDEFARVLDTDGAVIDGLYAGGNTTASVMGRTYPGPGSTIGPAMTFGYIAGRHASARTKEAATHADGVTTA